MATVRDGDGPIVVSRAAPERAALVDRFGGFDLPASLVGVLVALALELLLVAGAAAVLGTSFELSDISTDLAVGTLAAGVLIMFLAYFVGGWAAARIARYNGVFNGVMVAVIGLLLAAAFGALGAWAGEEYNVFEAIGAPTYLFDVFDAFGTEAIIAAVTAIAAMFGGAALGGLLGDRYHRKADNALASVRTGGIARDGGGTTVHQAAPAREDDTTYLRDGGIDADDTTRGGGSRVTRRNDDNVG